MNHRPYAKLSDDELATRLREREQKLARANCADERDVCRYIIRQIQSEQSHRNNAYRRQRGAA